MDRPLLLLNLCLIAFVAFLPFSTAVLANYSWGESSGASISVMLYSLNMLLIGLAFLALWVYLYRHIAMFVAGVTTASVRNSIVRSTVVPLAYLASMGLAFVNTKICYAIWFATTIYIAFGPATRGSPRGINRDTLATLATRGRTSQRPRVDPHQRRKSIPTPLTTSYSKTTG